MDLSIEQAADFKDRQKVRAEDKSAAFGLRTGAQKKATGGSPKNDWKWWLMMVNDGLMDG